MCILKNKIIQQGGKGKPSFTNCPLTNTLFETYNVNFNIYCPPQRKVGALNIFMCTWDRGQKAKKWWQYFHL